MLKNLLASVFQFLTSKNYRRIVAIQAAVIFTALLLKDVLVEVNVAPEVAGVLRDCVFLPLVAIYGFSLWGLLAHFKSKKWLLQVTKWGIASIILTMLATVNPFAVIDLPDSFRTPVYLYIHLGLFVIESLVIYRTIIDIFSGEKLSAEKLWGAACIFLMIGLSFGSAYDLIVISDETALGVNVEIGLNSYAFSIYYSMATIGGLDAYPDAKPLVQNLRVVEAVWSNLFIVLLVGRILAKPAKEEKT